MSKIAWGRTLRQADHSIADKRHESIAENSHTQVIQ